MVSPVILGALCTASVSTCFPSPHNAGNLCRQNSIHAVWSLQDMISGPWNIVLQKWKTTVEINFRFAYVYHNL